MQVNKWILIPAAMLLACCQGNTAREQKTADSATVVTAANLITKDTATLVKDDEPAPDPDHAALGWDALREYLPAVKGLATPDRPSGENSFRGNKSRNLYYAYARQIYKKGSDSLVVEIIDYNNDPATYKGLLNMYGFATPVNNDQLATKKVDMGVEHVQALEMDYKQEQRAQLILAVGDRFLITIVQEGSKNPALLNKVAKSIKLDEMIGKYIRTSLTAK